MYAYCANDPINYVDPSGHFAVTATVATWTAADLIFTAGVVWFAGKGVCDFYGSVTGKKKVEFKTSNKSSSNKSSKNSKKPDKRKVKSTIKDTGLVKAAREMGENEKVQKEVNSIINKMILGNTNPGIGSKNLFKNINYLRTSSGGRIFFRNISGGIEILAKACKKNEDKVISILRKLYK